MNDMSSVIVAKSDQINADDLVSGPRTIRISGVKINAGTEQPVSISIEGETKVWRPCKTTSRVLVAGWGADANQYIGRLVTLYRDPGVKWGGMAVGGIRISAMSDIDPKKLSDGKMTLALKESRNHSKPCVIKLLENQPATNGDRVKAEQWLAGYLANPVETDGSKRALAKLERNHPDLYAQAMAPKAGAAAAVDDDPFDTPSPAAANPPGEASPQPDGDAAGAGQGATVFERMSALAEGLADSDMGEAVTLAGAKDMIEKQTEVAEVNRLFDSLKDGFDDGEQDELRNFAAERCNTILREKGGE